MRIMCAGRLDLIQFWRTTFVIIVALPVILMLSGCLKIDTIAQPQYAHGGEVIEITQTVHTTSDDSNTFTPYGGIHLPTGWTVVEPVNYQGSYTGHLTYEADLAVGMEELYPQAGYAWWVGSGGLHGPITAGQTATATWHIRTGPQPGFYALDYAVGDGTYEPHDIRMHVPITVTVNYGALWQPVPTAYARTGQATTLHIPLHLVNIGEAGSDSFNLSLNPPAGWSAQFAINGAATTHTGVLPLFQSQSIELRLTVPASVSRGQFIFPVIATSAVHPTAVATAPVEVIVFGPEGLTPLLGQPGSASDAGLFQEPTTEPEVQNSFRF